MKVLFIGDNQQISSDITFSLGVRYTEVSIVLVSKGAKGIYVLESEPADLVMVDSSLPDMDTLALVAKIREFSDVPLILLYEGESEIDRAKGLEMGADEYVTKPFSPIELLAKVKALLRRARGVGFKPEHVVSFAGGLTINFTTHEVFLSGKRVRLTPIEYRLLSELVRNKGRVVTHSSLLEMVWGPEYVGDFSFTKRYIYHLRQKLHDDSDNPRMIHTEHGVGYRFIAST